MSINPQLTQTMLERDQQAAQALLLLLQQEGQLLQARDHQELTDLIDEKSKHIHVLNGHADERLAVLESLGMAPTHVEWENLLASDPALAPCLPLWQEIKTILQQCQQLNDINGKLINRSQQTLVRLLDLVRGKTASPQLYNAAGASSHTPSSQTLTRA